MNETVATEETMICSVRCRCAVVLLTALFWAAAPLGAQTTSFRFVSWSDSREYNCVVYGLSPLISAKNPAFTIFPGDLTPNTDVATDTQNLNNCPGKPSQTITWKSAVNGGNPGSGLWDKTFATKGNHDDVAGDWLTYFNFAGVASHVAATNYSEFLSSSTCGVNPCHAYSFDYGNSHFIGSDVMSSGNVSDLPADVVRWMDSDLTSAENRPGIHHAFLFWHGPFYYVDGHVSTPSADLVNVFNKHAIIAATFHGHEHLEAHVHVDSAHIPGLSLPFEEFITGGAGAPLYSCTASRLQTADWCVGQTTDAAPLGPGFKGYSTVDVQQNNIAVTFYDDSDVQRGTFSFTHSVPTTPQSGWWVDPNLGGVGFFIEDGGKSGNGMFVAAFTYDAGGNATWLVSTGQMSGSTYSGTWLKANGGQTLLGPSKGAPTLTGVGNLAIHFTDASHAVMTRPDGSQINVQRFLFGATPTPESGTPQIGWWYSGVNNGVAYGIEFQGAAVFIVAYAYDDAGNPVWYLATGGLTTPTSYSGTWDVYAGGAQLTAPDGTPGARKVNTATPMSLTFSDATHATLTMGNVTIQLVRFQEF